MSMWPFTKKKSVTHCIEMTPKDLPKYKIERIENPEKTVYKILYLKYHADFYPRLHSYDDYSKKPYDSFEEALKIIREFEHRDLLEKQTVSTIVYP